MFIYETMSIHDFRFVHAWCRIIIRGLFENTITHLYDGMLAMMEVHCK